MTVNQYLPERQRVRNNFSNTDEWLFDLIKEDK